MFTDDIIRRALEEDLGHGDLTTDSTVPENLRGVGRLRAKEDLVLAGFGVAAGVFVTLDPRARIKQLAKDGDVVSAWAVVMEVEGKFGSLLKGERTALNFIQRMSGIATLTKKFVDAVADTKTKILDTRKTVPLLRHLDKYAVRMGGGTNHRLGLYDAILIKDNHVAACGGSHVEAIRRARRTRPQYKIEVEIQKIDQIEPVLDAGASRLLLDNMTDADITACLKKVKGRASVEISGGISLDRVADLAKMGVDFISVGALTHSPRAADLSFKIGLK